MENSDIPSTPPNNEEAVQYWSYEQIHQLVAQMAVPIKQWKPDLILAIGGGGKSP
jgi:hypoxanthine phosphoribosyltransferase